MGITRRFFSHWQNWLGLFIVIMFVLTALFAPLLSPLDLDTQDEAISSFLKVPKPPAPGAPLHIARPDQRLRCIYLGNSRRAQIRYRRYKHYLFSRDFNRYACCLFRWNVQLFIDVDH